MRLRDRPLKLAALVAFGTLGLLWMGHDLLDGEVDVRRFGYLSAEATPIRFWLFVTTYLGAWGFIMLGWMVVRDEWTIDYRPRWKPPLDRPSHRRD